MSRTAGRLAVVLFNLGGPDGLEAVEPFLFNLFNDPAIIGLPQPARWAVAKLISSRRRKMAAVNYAYMGGASPLLRETQAQADALKLQLERETSGWATEVFIAMRYWKPFTEDAARGVAAFTPDEIVLLPLYPQFSTTTTGSSLKAWREVYKGSGRVHAVCCWFDAHGLVEASARRIRETWDAAGRPESIRVLFSAHGLPERIVARGDPYQHQVERTCAAVAERLSTDWPGELDWRVCYQSRVGPMKWLGPSTPEAIEAATRDGKGVLVVPIAFVSEHVETLVELDRDYAEFAARVGCRPYLRAPTVGADPTLIEALARKVITALDRPGLGPGASSCAGGWAGCPYRRSREAA